VFGNHNVARRWLRTRNFALGGITPRDLLKTSEGERVVLNELQAQADGVASSSHDSARPRRYEMTSITVRLTDREMRMLKARTGETAASAALKAWITRANPKRPTAELRAALKESLKEEFAGKRRSFQSGREAMHWLGN
jgi:hypothetical protein